MGALPTVRTELSAAEYTAFSNAAKDGLAGNGAKVSKQYLRLANENGKEVLKYEAAGGVLGFIKRLFSSQYNLATISAYLSTKKIIPKDDQLPPGQVLSWFNSKLATHNSKKKDTIPALVLRHMYVPQSAPSEQVRSVIQSPKQHAEALQQTSSVALNAMPPQSPKMDVPPGGAVMQGSVPMPSSYVTPEADAQEEVPQAPDKAEVHQDELLPSSPTHQGARPPGGLFTGPQSPKVDL